jgi:hypothetical protein
MSGMITQTPARTEVGSGCTCLSCAITEVNHTAPEAALLQQLELQSNVVREGWFAASYDEWCKEQQALIDQPGSKGAGSQLRASDGDILFAGLLQ